MVHLNERERDSILGGLGIKALFEDVISPHREEGEEKKETIGNMHEKVGLQLQQHENFKSFSTFCFNDTTKIEERSYRRR